MTHGQVVRGTGGTTADARVQIGANITLPAGGPWIIHGLWIHVAQTTGVADEPLAGHLQIDSVSGDLTPDPAPGKYPMGGYSSPVSAAFGSASMPLNIWPVLWVAAGKAVVALYHVPTVALAVAPACAAGIIYSSAVPEVKPLVFCDTVSSDFSSTAESTIGTITLSEKAKKIVGICGTITCAGAPAVDIPVIGTFRLTSDDAKIVPLELPFNQALGPADGTLAGATSIGRTKFIPVDIDVPGGSRVTALATTIEAVTNNSSVQVFVAAE